jgi:hypothetical protein
MREPHLGLFALTPARANSAGGTARPSALAFSRLRIESTMAGVILMA